MEFVVALNNYMKKGIPMEHEGYAYNYYKDGFLYRYPKGRRKAAFIPVENLYGSSDWRRVTNVLWT